MYKHDHMVRAGLWSEDDWLFTVRDAAICQAPSALKQAPITARLLFNGLSYLILLPFHFHHTLGGFYYRHPPAAHHSISPRPDCDGISFALQILNHNE